MREDIVSADDDGMMDTRSADAANPKLTSSGLLHLTAKIAAEIYVGRAGEPVGPRNAQRTYEIHDAVNEAAALLTVALTPSLAADSYRIAAATYGVPSLLDVVAANETVD
jgi:hypothetical protein